MPPARGDARVPLRDAARQRRDQAEGVVRDRLRQFAL
eukprot:COSAG04_NODE_6133_length_1402_cov_1.361474_1_plen_36_part_10